MRNSKNTWQSFIISLGLLLILASSCKKEEAIKPVPYLSTSAILSLGSNSATIITKIRNDEGSEVTSGGIYWSTIFGTTDASGLISGEVKDGTLYCKMPGLTPNTMYLAVVYAINHVDTTYSNEISFTTNNTVTDIDGNVYNTIRLGSQVWMVENLKTTRYADGQAIPLINDNSAWLNLNSPVYCWYDNNKANGKIYGALYNGPAVNTGKLCPRGWHVPSDAEWTTLTNFLGGESQAGGLLKEVGDHWSAPNYDANNFSGFTALPGGAAVAGNPTFLGISKRGYWWSSTIDDNEFNIYREMYFENNLVDRNGFMLKGNANNGLSVRCIKD